MYILVFTINLLLIYDYEFDFDYIILQKSFKPKMTRIEKQTLNVCQLQERT